MSDYGMYPFNSDKVKRWTAEMENATARTQLELVRECCELLIDQHEPVNSLGINRDHLDVLLRFVLHHDVSRLKREVDHVIKERGEG